MADEDEDIATKDDYELWEQVQSRSPAVASFSLEDSKARVPYFINGEKISLEDAVRSILGGCKASGAGGLNRRLPRSHPEFRWLFAHAIPEVVGLGRATLIPDDGEEDFEAPAVVPAYAEYTQRLISVEFSQRPYAVLGDDGIPEPFQIVWTDEDDSERASIATSEFLRFTDYDVLPALDVLSAQQGQLKFRTTGSAPNNIPFSGFPSIRQSRATIRYRWYAVPFSFVDSDDSWITNHIGKVNQFRFLGREPGSLLYAGCTVSRRYTPPFPEALRVEGATRFSTEKLCDLEFIFEYTKRPAGSTAPTPASANWIAGGHNLQPWLTDKGFHYATGELADDPSDEDWWLPSFVSFPLELLFSDPDV